MGVHEIVLYKKRRTNKFGGKTVTVIAESGGVRKVLWTGSEEDCTPYLLAPLKNAIQIGFQFAGDIIYKELSSVIDITDSTNES
jgi:hypothetical protein